jgi:hypothetical protein
LLCCCVWYLRFPAVVWGSALYGAEILTLVKLDHKHLTILEMYCCRRLDRVSWTDRLKNEKVIKRIKADRNRRVTVLVK